MLEESLLSENSESGNFNDTVIMNFYHELLASVLVIDYRSFVHEIPYTVYQLNNITF